MVADGIEKIEIDKNEENTVKVDQNVIPTENAGQESGVLNKESNSAQCESICQENALKNEVNKEKKILFDYKLAVRIYGFQRQTTIAEELNLYYTFFTEEMGISPPYVEIPALEGDHVLFQVKSEDDKKKLFTKMNGKIYIWKSYKLEIKGLPWSQRGTNLKRLSLEEALKILYPYKSLPYAQQLKEKTDLSEVIIDLIFPKKKSSGSSIPELQVNKIEPILPMVSAEGYDYNVSFGIEEDPETAEVIAGIRVTSDDNKKATIVPIEHCLSVPHQMSLVLKHFLKHSSELGLRPYDNKTSEGDILGVTLQMTMSSHFMMTVMTPSGESELRQVTAHLEEEEERTIKLHSDKNKKNEKEIIEKLEKYFQNYGKKMGIDSIYLTSIKARAIWFISDENSTPVATHILGEVSISDNYNGMIVPITRSNDLMVNNSLKPILNVVEEKGNLNYNSRIHLISTSRMAALYLAKKYKHVKMYCDTIKDNLNSLYAWSKSTELDNIDFADYSKNFNPLSISKDNAVVIVWRSTQPTLVRQLLDSGIKNLILVSYWKKNPSFQFLKKYQKQLVVIVKNLDVSYIYPIDVAPYTERHGLVVFFKESLNKSFKRNNNFEVEQNKKRRLSTWHRRRNRNS